MAKNKPEGTGTSNGPVEFRSVRAMNKHIEAHAKPLWSENPCLCGQAKRWKHKYCDECAEKQRRRTKTTRQRKWRASL